MGLLVLSVAAMVMFHLQIVKVEEFSFFKLLEKIIWIIREKYYGILEEIYDE